MGITARGVGLLVAAVVLLGVGFRFAYPELTLLGAAAGAAVGYAALVAAWRPRLTVTRLRRPGPGGARRAGEHDVDRAQHRPAAVGEPAGRGPVRGPRLCRCRCCACGPGRDTEVRYDVPTHRRGVVPVGPLRVTRRDPLGLVALARPYGATVPVWVHPRVHPLTAVPTGAGRSLDGRVDGVPHGSITFDSLREYVVGDELRRVHWRTSARVGELMVRENVDTSLPRLVVLLDNRAAAHPERVGGVAESFESACEAAASIVTAAHRADLPVVLLFAAAEPAGPATPGGEADGGGASGRWTGSPPPSCRATATRSARPPPGCGRTGSATR